MEDGLDLSTAGDSGRPPLMSVQDYHIAIVYAQHVTEGGRGGTEVFEPYEHTKPPLDFERIPDLYRNYCHFGRLSTKPVVFLRPRSHVDWALMLSFFHGIKIVFSLGYCASSVLSDKVSAGDIIVGRPTCMNLKCGRANVHMMLNGDLYLLDVAQNGTWPSELLTVVSEHSPTHSQAQDHTRYDLFYDSHFFQPSELTSLVHYGIIACYDRHVRIKTDHSIASLFAQDVPVGLSREFAVSGIPPTVSIGGVTNIVSHGNHKEMTANGRQLVTENMAQYVRLLIMRLDPTIGSDPSGDQLSPSPGLDTSFPIMSIGAPDGGSSSSGEHSVLSKLVREAEIVLRVDWELKAYLDNEKRYGLTGEHELTNRLTFTGNLDTAIGMACSTYLDKRWEGIGRTVLEAVIKSLGANPHDFAVHEDICISSSDGENPVVILGALWSDRLGEVIEILAWIAMTFRPMDNILDWHLSIWSSKFKTQPLVGIHQVITLDPLVEAKRDNNSVSCWHALLCGNILTDGLSMAIVSPGLELPVETMFELCAVMYRVDLSRAGPSRQSSDAEIQARYFEESTADTISSDTIGVVGPVCPQGSDDSSSSGEGFYYRGLQCLLYPTAADKDKGLVRWHYMEGSEMLPPIDGFLTHLTAEYLESATAILGFCTDARVDLGTKRRNDQNRYDQMKNTLVKDEFTTYSVKLDAISFQAGYSRNGGSGTIGATTKWSGHEAVRVSAQQSRYSKVILEALETPAVLYETEEERQVGWLVSQAGVILDLIHWECRLWDWKEGQKLHIDGGVDVMKGLKSLFLSPEIASLELGHRTGDEKPTTVASLVQELWSAMKSRRDAELARERVLGRQVRLPYRNRLLGWDLKEILLDPHESTRKYVNLSTDSSNSPPTWMKLVAHLPVYFCHGLGEIISSINLGTQTLSPANGLLVAQSSALTLAEPSAPAHCHCGMAHLILIRGQPSMIWEVKEADFRSPPPIQVLVPVNGHECTAEQVPGNRYYPRGAIYFQ